MWSKVVPALMIAGMLAVCGACWLSFLIHPSPFLRLKPCAVRSNYFAWTAQSPSSAFTWAATIAFGTAFEG